MRRPKSSGPAQPKREPRKREPIAGTGAGDWLRRIGLASAGPAGQAAVDAHERGESVLAAMGEAVARVAFGSLAGKAYAWVAEKRGRKVVLEWVDEKTVQLRWLEPDGSER